MVQVKTHCLLIAMMQLQTERLLMAMTEVDDGSAKLPLGMMHPTLLLITA